MFDGLANWWNNIFGSKKKNEKSAQVSTDKLATVKPTTLSVSPTSTSTKSLLGQNIQTPSISSTKTPQLTMSTADVNKSLIAPKKTAPSHNDAPYVLTPDARNAWNHKADVKDNLDQAITTSNPSNTIKYSTEMKYLDKGYAPDKAAKIGQLAQDIASSEQDRSKQSATIDAVDTVTTPLRRFSSGYLKNLSKTPSDIVGGVGALGQAITPDNWSLNKTFGDLNKWGVSKSNDIDKFFDDKAKVKSDGLAGDIFEAAGQITPDVLTSMIPGAAAAKLPVYANDATKLAKITKAGTLLPAIRYGAQETGSQYAGAKDAGMSDAEAGIIGTGAGAAQAALEKVGLDKLLPGSGNLLKSVVRRAAVEGSQEGAQQFASNAFRSTYNPNQDLMDGVPESAIIGAVVGGGMGPINTETSGGTNSITRVASDSSAPNKANTRDHALPSVTSIVPSNETERKVAIDNGIVTPETSSLSIDEKVQTALNSAIADKYRTDNTNYRVNDASTIDREKAQFLISRGYTTVTDSSGVTSRLSDIASGNYDGSQRIIINSVNPSGGIVNEYTPEVRATAQLADNMATLDQTTGGTAGDVVTIYRGAPSGQTAINPGDFVTTDPLLAASYTGDGNVLALKVRKGDVVDDLTDPAGGEYLYRPQSADKMRTGDAFGSATRGDMLAVQNENNRMFGDGSPNVKFVDKLNTPDGSQALGSTVDSPTGPSDIRILRDQGDVQATYFHEAVHKTLNDFTTQEERTQILMSYAADKRIDSSMSELQIEELVAEDFIQYVAARNDEKVSSPSVAKRITDIFARIFRRIQHVVATNFHNKTLTPAYQTFYNDLYSGKYATRQVIDKQIRNGATPEQIQLQEHLATMRRQYDTTPDATAKRTISREIARLQHELTTSTSSTAKTAYRSENTSDGTPKMTEEQYLASQGYRFLGSHEPALDRQPGITEKQLKRSVAEQQKKAATYYDKRQQLRKEYSDKVANGEIIEPTPDELLAAAANGNEDLESTQAAKRAQVKRQLRAAGVTFDNTESLSSLAQKLANASSGDSVSDDTTMTDRNGNKYAESQIPVSKLVRNADYQPRVTASGKGTENSVYEKGYNEGMVDQPLLVRKNGDNYEVLGGHSRTLGMERRAAEGLSNPETVKARVYTDISDTEAKRIARAANQGGQYESTLDMAKSISESMVEGQTPSVQKQNMVKGYNYDDYNYLWGVVKEDSILSNKVYEGAVPQEDVLDAARYARRKDIDTDTMRGIIGSLVSKEKFTKQNVHNVVDLLHGKIEAKLMKEAQVDLFGNTDMIVDAVDLLGEYQKTRSELVRRANVLSEASQELSADSAGYKDLQDAKQTVEGKLSNITDEIIKRHNDMIRQQTAARVENGAQTVLDESPADLGSLRKPTDYTMSAAKKERLVKKMLPFVDEQTAREVVRVAPHAVTVADISNRIHKLSLPDGKSVVKVLVSGGDRARSIDVSTKESRAKSIYVKGSKSDSKIINIPVSTPETRRVNIPVKGRKSSAMEFIARMSIDEGTGKQTFELVPLDSKRYQLKNGTVIDKDGHSVGSYVAIENDGTQTAYIEGKPINITGILGDIEAWGNVNKATWDMDRLIEANAPDEPTARKVQKFVTQFKDQQEAMMKTELVSLRKELQVREQAAMKHRPSKVSKKQLSSDLFLVTEKKMSYQELQAKYPQEYIDNYIKPTVSWWRKTADHMLESTNDVLVRNGFDEIPRLDNYISHIQADPSFWEKVGIGIRELNPMGSSIDSDINPGGTRKGVPDEIVGNTENTNARRRWNPFAQTRRGSQFEADFFKSIDSYFEPMLFNKYMTPAASRARVVERTFRTFEKARDIAEQKKIDQLSEAFGLYEAKKMVASDRRVRSKKYKTGINGPFVTAWQEYGNILAGKTNKIDRAVIDSSDTAAKALRGSSRLQSLTGQATIPGSATAAVAQVLSVPQTIGRDSMGSFAAAVKDMITFEGKRKGSADPMRKSNFMRDRYVDATSRRKSFVRRYTSAVSAPMEAIERSTGELSWRSAYHEALKSGLSEREAILKADVETKKTLAGRGIGDRPMAMNSKTLGVFTQFGLEVNNMRIQFFNDFTPAQKVKFMVAAYAMNAAFQAITGNDQLPDYLKAIFDTIGDFSDSEDDKKDTVFDNVVQAFQRMIGETSRFIPGASSIAGTFMDDTTKEAYFGKNGDVSRYGAPAMSKVLGVGKDIITGDFGKAATDAAAMLPSGSQVKRTGGGIGALQQGYTEDSRGNVHNVYDNTDPATVIKAILFGTNSIPGETDAWNRNMALSKDQTAVFKKLYESDPAAAKQYFNNMMRQKMSDSDRKGTLTDTGVGSIASATDGKSVASLRTSGTPSTNDSSKSVLLSDLTLTSKGKVDRSYYKDLASAASNRQDDATYAAYLYGYGLEEGTKYEASTTTSSSSTGSQTIDKLKSASKADSGSSAASTAVALYKGSDEYANIPQWVKNRYYREAGLSEKDVEYGALASFSATTKLDNYYRPMAESISHDDLMNALYQGRKQSIYKNGYVAAQDSIITSLQKEGYISKSEAKYLKSIKIDKNGDEVSTSSSSGKSSITSSLIDEYLSATKDKGASDMASIIKKYAGATNSAPKLSSSSPRMRSMKSRRSSTKREKIML